MIDWNKPIYFPKAFLGANPQDQIGKYTVLTTTRNHSSGRCVVFLGPDGSIYTSSIDGNDVRTVDDLRAHYVANIPETVEIDVWLNIYPYGLCVKHRYKAEADREAGPDRIACINIKRTVIVGEGIDK